MAIDCEHFPAFCVASCFFLFLWRKKEKGNWNPFHPKETCECVCGHNCSAFVSFHSALKHKLNQVILWFEKGSVPEQKISQD